ncbi:MAG TPA: hypothetical protein VIL77_02740 [Gaiellaceae bacterium]
MITAVTLAAAALSASSVGAPARPALSVSPAHLALTAGGKATVHIGAVSRGQLLLRASVAGLALDPRGRPQIVSRRDAATWLTVRPRTISAGKTGATFVVTSRRPSSARPGDHTAIVLLTATAAAGKGIAIGMRVGLVVTVRVGGRSIRRVEVVAARIRQAPGGAGRLIAVTVANRGARIESIGGARLAVTLLRRGRVIGCFRVARRPLLPYTRAVVTIRCRAVVRGVLVARVAIVRPDGRTAARRFRLRM